MTQHADTLDAAVVSQTGGGLWAPSRQRLLFWLRLRLCSDRMRQESEQDSPENRWEPKHREDLKSQTPVPRTEPGQVGPGQAETMISSLPSPTGTQAGASSSV